MAAETKSDQAQVARLEAELAAARRTVAALMRRVERLEGNTNEESGAMARALAGMQRELARRTRTLEETEATYRALYEGTPDPLLTVDAMGVVLAANRTAIEWLGQPSEELVGRPLADVFESSDAALLDRLASVDWTGVSERRFTLSDGRRTSINAAAIEGTNPRRHHLTIRDVTNLEALEEAEVHRGRMMALSALAGSLARELNDPMSIVLGRIELLLELGEAGKAGMERHLTVALAHARRMSATLRNLRLVGRTPVPHLGRVFLSEILDDAIDLVGPRIQKVEFLREIEPEDLPVGGEAAMYARVFANLLEWMLDLCGKGGRIEVHARRKSGAVEVRLLADSSVPRSTRLVPPPPGAGSGDTDDVGFGLSIARTLVTSVGGQLEARSAGSRGMVRMTLPAAPGVRARARKVEDTLLAIGAPTFLTSIEQILAREGFELVSVADAEEALLELERNEEIGAVATELLLPGMSGLAFGVEAIRRFPHLTGKVLVVSAAPILALPEGVTGLTAPLRRERLLTALGRRVRARR